MNGGNEIRAETQPSPFVERLLVFLGTVVGRWLLSILDNREKMNALKTVYETKKRHLHRSAGACPPHSLV